MFFGRSNLLQAEELLIEHHLVAMWCNDTPSKMRPRAPSMVAFRGAASIKALAASRQSAPELSAVYDPCGLQGEQVCKGCS